MADEQLRQTSPKPFVFVLMPFDPAFNDIYTFGIRGAADDAGAYAERVDEQIFQEGMMDRVYNEISKADVIVADMSGRNPNVFYEVGYAHALNKIVLLLTKDADDIPFDLKHRQHIVYESSIERLREQLAPRIRWAIGASKQRERREIDERFQLTINAIDIPADYLNMEIPTVKIIAHLDDSIIDNDLTDFRCHFTVHLRNASPEAKSISHMYICLPHGVLDSYNQVVTQLPADDAQGSVLDQVRIAALINALPPGAVEPCKVDFAVRLPAPLELPLRATLRIHGSRQYYDYPFFMTWDIEKREGSIRLLPRP